jgi:NAD(P)-dependent dehydrogenase (short-subunit alcohol dehydrogenase family)
VQRSLFFFGRMCREALPHLKRQRAGRIINILASTVYQPIPNLVLSGVTRMGVVAFAKTLADEVGRDGILVNNVCPGSIMSERMLSNVTARAKQLGIPLEERWPSARPRPRSAAWASRRSWPIWSRSSPPASRATSPGPRSWSTAASSAPFSRPIA